MATGRSVLLIALGVIAGARAQLRPRRVGTNAMGDQEVVMTDVPTGGGGMGGMGAGGGLEEMAAAMGEAMKGGGDFDPSAMLKGMDMANNPMLQQLAASNPELAAVLNDPEALATQMEQVKQMMSSPEGQEMAGDMMKKMMGEMQSVMTDPEKLKAGLEQFSSNPALRGIAE